MDTTTLHAHGKYRNKWNTEKGRQQFFFFYIRMDKSTITNTRKIQTIKGNTISTECQSKCMWEFRIEFELGRNGEDISLRTQCMAVDAQWEVHGCSMDGWRLLWDLPGGTTTPALRFKIPSLLALFYHPVHVLQNTRWWLTGRMGHPNQLVEYDVPSSKANVWTLAAIRPNVGC